MHGVVVLSTSNVKKNHNYGHAVLSEGRQGRRGLGLVVKEE